MWVGISKSTNMTRESECVGEEEGGGDILGGGREEEGL